MPVSSSCMCVCLFVPHHSHYLSECTDTFQAWTSLWWCLCLKGKAIQSKQPWDLMKFVCCKFLLGADEGRNFIEASSTASGTLGAAERPHLYGLFQRKKTRDERRRDVDHRESSVNAVIALCTSAEVGVRDVRFCFSVIVLPPSFKMGTPTSFLNWEFQVTIVQY